MTCSILSVFQLWRLNVIIIILLFFVEFDKDVPSALHLCHELFLVVLSDSQRIGADLIIDEREWVVDMCGDPIALH
jgi:hypothetical protein